ncbi:23S rRNA (cytidine-2'-O)-methyltransferase TlyA [Hydrogenimonas sp.]
MRLDRLLVARGLVESRNKAQALVKEGGVLVDGETVRKPAAEVPESADVTIVGETRYVGRAARKLEGLFEAYPVAVEGKRCLDVGASTGGFTQILLEHGAAHVTALDVGKEQLHPTLRQNPKVEVKEGCDIRRYTPERPYEVTTCDISFISLTHVLQDLDRVTDGVVIVLFKPQFEVGREAGRDVQGVVTDEGAIREAMGRFEEAAAKLGWRLMAKAPSTLPGKEGNREWFYIYRT